MRPRRRNVYDARGHATHRPAALPKPHITAAADNKNKNSTFLIMSAVATWAPGRSHGFLLLLLFVFVWLNGRVFGSSFCDDDDRTDAQQ